MPASRVSLVIASWWACSGALGLLGCHERPERLVVGRVLVDIPPALDEEPGARDAIRDEVVRHLREIPRTEVIQDDGRATHLVRVQTSTIVYSEVLKAEARPVQVVLQPLGQGKSFAAVGRGDPGVDTVGSVLDGFRDAMTVITRARELDVAEDRDVIGALAHADARIRDEAIQTLGRRKSKAAVEPLCALLEHETESALVLRAVGALVAIGDTRAVPAIVKLGERKDPAFVSQIIFAVGAIGGPSAEGYLVTVASGHPLEPIRQAAEDALTEMQDRPR